MKPLKDKLRLNELTVGSWVTLGHPSIAEIMARAGFDWVVIDLEHSTIDLSVAGDLIRTVDSLNVPCLIRTTSNDRDQIKRVLDAGATGIIVPSINSKSAATEAVKATQYPPNGTRGVGLGRAHQYGFNFKDYFERTSKEIVVIVMIEDVIGVTNIQDILSTEGVDGCLIGPYDLSCSLGIPGEFDNPIFINAIAAVKKAGDSIKRPYGIHIVEPNPIELENKIKEGYKFIAFGVDIRILDIACRNATKYLKF